MSEYFGKYRGSVARNVDPQGQGRIQVSVPGVTGGGAENWAMPCTPLAGSGIGLLAIPPVGADVWVEYEGGNPDQPIWSGCFWGTLASAPLPPAATATPDKVVVLKTSSCTVTLSDLPGPLGGITLELQSGMKVTLGAQSLEITNGTGATIKLEGPKVTINDPALEVM